jgi:TolB protein
MENDDTPPWDTDIPESEDFDAESPVWTADGETLFFLHTREGTDANPGRFNQLWKVDLNTGNREQVAPGRLTTPDVSPDEEWVVFHSRAQFSHLYKLHLESDSLVALTGPDSPNPDLDATIVGRWSPSGDRILYTRSAGEPRGLSMMNPDGTEAEIVIPYGVQGDWFPDGERVVYVNWDMSEEDPGRRKQIYVANADGSGAEKITDLPNSDTTDPSVSPDGTQIVFAYGGDEGLRNLYVMNADGSNLRQITGGKDGSDQRPAWHPTEEKIVFERAYYTGYQRVSSLYTVDLKTLDVEPVFPAD